ncbi:MAG: ATPase [Prevotellaceae bacterium]|nr:ATPase [Prevotellaceae bacterium]
MTLIADSGSTKTDWLVGGHLAVPLPNPLPGEGLVASLRTTFRTIGINPARDSLDTIREALRPLPRLPFTRVHFYGAGCIPPFDTKVRTALQEIYPNANIRVESDLIGAALALCREKEGIACILGTGSNSCLWDGQGIAQHTPPLGYILGDEGGGASLGRRLVSDLLKGQLPADLRQSFLQRFSLTPKDIIEQVYSRPMPNRWLASLVPFLQENQDRQELRGLIVAEFRLFIRRNVCQYRRPDLPLSFTGGIAYSFQSLLSEACQAEGYQLGKVLLSPLQDLALHL